MKNNNTKIALALISVLVTIMLTSPVVYGYLFCPLDSKFLGVAGLRPIEQFYYFSEGPSQAIRGHLLFTDKYGRLPAADILINPIGNIIGLISQVTGTSLSIAFNIFRIASSLLLIFSFYFLAKQIITSSFTLLVAIILYCFSAGFDSIFHLFNFSLIDAVDDSMPEANMFISMSGEYYLPLANALFILTLSFAYKLIYKKQKQMLLCGLSLLTLGAVYVYGLVTAVIIISIAALYTGYSEKQTKRAIIIISKLLLFCLPIVGYYLWLVFRFPSIDDEGWFSFPNFWALISTFGFAFLFVTLGLFLKSRRKISDETFLLLWVAITLILVYLPQPFLPIQIQILIGLGAPLSIMFTTSLETISKLAFQKITALSKNARNVLSGMFIFSIAVLSASTNFSFYTQQFSDLQKHVLPWYIDSEVYNAMEWSAQNISEKKLVITSRKLGFIFSSVTACPVYTGVARFREKTLEQKDTEKALKLLKANRVEEASQLFSETEADYIFLDKSLSGADFQKFTTLLKTIYVERFNNPEVSIFQLK
ncbi:MAG: hypothetical protein V4615_13645 [Bacteroidota bacterium]